MATIKNLINLKEKVNKTLKYLKAEGLRVEYGPSHTQQTALAHSLRPGTYGDYVKQFCSTAESCGRIPHVC